MGLMLMLPPFPLSDVDADMVVFSAIVRFSVSMLIVPASPLPVVSTVILPSPVMLMFSGANMLMSPPSPMEVVRADMKPFSLKVILRLGSNPPLIPLLGGVRGGFPSLPEGVRGGFPSLYGLILRVPAGLSPAVSANIPNLPEMNSSLALMVIFPPASVLVAFSLAVALIWAFSPMVSFSVVISISPAFPALLVSVVRLVPFSRVKSLVLMLIWPALPLSSVEADMATPSDILKFSVWMSIIPALPVPDVSTAMKPWPDMSMFSGAVMNMLPPLPVEEVEAEMKPSLLKLMSRSWLFL